MAIFKETCFKIIILWFLTLLSDVNKYLLYPFWQKIQKFLERAIKTVKGDTIKRAE